MAGVYGLVTTTPTEVSQLTRSTIHTGKNVTLLSSAGAVVRGQIMGQITASQKWVPVDPDASDGSEIARGILGILEGETITADSVRYMFMAGEYNLADVAWTTGMTAEQKTTALQQLEDRGIAVA